MEAKIYKNIAESKLRPCMFCQKHPNVTERFKACSNCKIAVYCSKECQQKHWPTHKTQCANHESGAGTSDEKGLKKLRKWKDRNLPGLCILAELVTTREKAKTNVLFVHLSFDDASTDNIKSFQIKRVFTVTQEQAGDQIKGACQNMIKDAAGVTLSPGEFYFFYFCVEKKGDPSSIFSNVACIRSNGSAPSHDRLDDYVRAINDGVGGFIH